MPASRLTLRQIEYFIAAGDTGSITLASERINISQPSISTAISQLEAELGIQLFVRHHAQGLSLTPVGKATLLEAKRLIEQVGSLYAVVSETTELVRGQLNVGCLTTLAPMVLPELAVSFQSGFPKAIVQPFADNHETLLNLLSKAELDVAISYDLQVPAEIDFQPLARLPVHAVVGETHPLAAQSAVTLEELSKLPLILLDLPISAQYFMSLFSGEGLQPRVGFRLSHPDVIRTMVANGYGYTLANVTPRSDYALDGRKVVRVRLAGDHRPMTIGLMTLKTVRSSNLRSAFLNHAASFISDSYIPGMVAPSMALQRATRTPVSALDFPNQQD